ncbi:SusD/RagB family nutrient-binding outer membrane lipoprotein [Pontibacter liquoris]|uniref:SusD/RagB family nutrient-binding outer membrane lipoprotein n=1 Tax=Pontibacter liquoris TaxID=2905677 RepID=UPI001FA6FF96|nr:SusD/RagB family nutrient-binding outer membrane lipoprotein [Pontibacter liquoris]
MKRIFKFFILGTIALSTVSCEHFLDINENPNQAIESTPQQVLPNALTNTAATTVTYNDYGSWHVGYIVNAGGFGGWGSVLTYNYTTSDYNNLWSTAYDNLNDYKYIETTSQGKEELAYYDAIAKIMIAYNYQLLVDTYGDVPYTEALQGSNKVTPAYDKADAIYQDLIANKLDSALYLINNSENAGAIKSGDVMFGGDMQEWERFANTLKLKALVRISEVPSLASFVNQEFASFNATTKFLEEDAIVNPGYAASAGKQNPMWERYHSSATGTAAGSGRSRIPSNFVLDFYDGTKIEDEARGAVTYINFPKPPTNTLGDEDADAPTAPSNNIAWFVGAGTGSNAANTVGIFKGRSMGQPLMLAAESYFLLAEAYARGLLTGDDQAAFNTGIERSFEYLYKNVNGNVESGYDPAGDAAAYIAANAGEPLVDYTAAGSVEKKIEAIITQKYIALNFIHGHEAWNEYRRTGYPAVTTGSTFASIKSASSRADKLPVRVLYPASEYQVNPKNAPSGVNAFNTPIFWDLD